MAENPFFTGGPTREECEEQLYAADDDVAAIFILWLIGFSVLMLVWVHAPAAFSLPTSPFQRIAATRALKLLPSAAHGETLDRTQARAQSRSQT